MHRKQHLLIGFCAVLAFAWFCYQPAISGTFQLDDEFNLGGLASVDDPRTAFDFIFSGISGPTGRPLALATFALQATSWEQGAGPFLKVNIFIHLLNAALLALSIYQLSLRRGIGRTDATIVAAATASLWVLMPLLATASLLVVQRMTTLSATFMLLGLNAYLFARGKVNVEPRRALAGMSVSLVIGTVLATLCKESGLLLPVFVLVLEATVLGRPAGVQIRHWRIWQSVFLVLPLVLLLGYLAGSSSYSEAMLAKRDFNAWERLLTQAGILWVYLSKAVIGIPSQLGIYQELPTISRGLNNPVTFLACVAWVALLVTSILWRRRYPLFAVAILWYLAGHLIESTVVPLELYFEHRNYVPIVGPLFAFCSFLFLYSARLRRAAGVLVPVLAIVSAWSLYGFASLSGDPSSASRYWAATYPNSQRAVSRMARFQLEEEGPLPALGTIEAFVSTHPEFAYMRIPELNLLCQYAPDHDHRQVIEQVHRELPVVDFNQTVALMLFELFNTVSASTCKGVDPDTVASLATTLQKNPRYTYESLYNQFHQKLLAVIAGQQGDYDATIDHLHKAMAHGQSSELNLMMVMALVGARRFDAARDFIDDAESLGPANPAKALIWQRDLDILRKQVLKLEQNAGTPPSG
jgi:hypothetical protein